MTKSERFLMGSVMNCTTSEVIARKPYVGRALDRFARRA